MSDINLLPIQERKREEDEEKKKMLEKSRVRIELSQPAKEKPKTKKADLKWSGFWLSVKAGLGKVKNIFKRKPKVTKIKSKKAGLPDLKPEVEKKESKDSKIVEHKQVKVSPEKKEFYYQKQAAAANWPEGNKPDERKVEKLAPEPRKIFAPPVVKQAKPDKKLESIRWLDKGEIELARKAVPAAQPVIDKKITDKKKQEPEQIELREKAAANLYINLIPSKIRSRWPKSKRWMIVGATAGVMVLILAGSYWYLNQQINIQQDEVAIVDKEIEVIKTKIETLKVEAEDASQFETLLKNAKSLLEQHTYASNAIKFLEDNTLKQIYYSDINYELDNFLVNLSAKSKDYEIMAQQMLLFQSLKNKVESVEINQAVMKQEQAQSQYRFSDPGEVEEELVHFNILLKFKPEVILKNSVD